MTTFMQKMALAGLLALAAGGASAAVEVAWIHIENFHDLPPGQDLRVEITDFDPAGHLVPSARFGRDLRVMSGRADWPRMDLRYTLVQDGQVIKSGEAHLQDMNYQQTYSHYFDSEPLRYEKQMIDDWFGKTIAPLRKR